MIVKLLTEHHLEFLSLKGGFRGPSKSTRVKLLEISCRGSYVKSHLHEVMCYYVTIDTLARESIIDHYPYPCMHWFYFAAMFFFCCSYITTIAEVIKIYQNGRSGA